MEDVDSSNFSRRRLGYDKENLLAVKAYTLVWWFTSEGFVCCILAVPCRSYTVTGVDIPNSDCIARSAV